MLDIRYIRENPEKVQQAAKEKGYSVNIADLLRVDDERRSVQQRVDETRAQKNRLSGQMKGGKPSPELVGQATAFKNALVEQEAQLKDLNQRYDTLLNQVPNITLDDVPAGNRLS